MPKRKIDQLRLPAELIRNAGVSLVIIVVLFFSLRAGAGFALHSDLFRIREVVIPEDLRTVKLSEVEGLIGQNIFTIDLVRLESRLRSKYPHLADLRVTKRFPGQVLLSAVRREPYARVAAGFAGSAGKYIWVIDRQGWIIAPAEKGNESGVLVQGLKDMRVLPGERISEERLAQALAIISLYTATRGLEGHPLESVDVADKDRFVLSVRCQQQLVEVFVPSTGFPARVQSLVTLLGRGSVDLTDVKYIDLRFGEPVIGKAPGKKKVKKP